MIMKIFPIKKQTILSNLSIEEILSAFKSHLEPLNKGIFRYSRRKKESTLFLGEIIETNFNMYHYIRYGSSFNPEIKGSIKSLSDNQSIIELQFTLPYEIKIILKLFNIFVVLFFLISFSSFLYNLFHNRIQIAFLIPLFLFIFSLLLTNFGMEKEISKSITDIKKILNDAECEVLK